MQVQSSLAATGIPESGRFAGLDGLRGMAALVVLITHAATVANALQIRAGGNRAEWNWLYDTPLRILVSGSEAVMVFFVLSGLVVSLPALDWRRYNWFAYYPRRFVRLYIPVIVAVAFAVGLLWLFPWPDRPLLGIWYDNTANFVDISLPDILFEASLANFEPTIDPPLWSLTWEVLAFSLFLPVFVIVGGWFRGSVRLVVGVSLGIVAMLAGGFTHNSFLTFLPVFFLGTLIAVNRSMVGLLWQRLAGANAPRWARSLVPWLVLAACWFLIVGAQLWKWLPTMTAVIGAVGLVILALFWGPAVKFLEHPISQWLGRISFSLYLVHTPVILAAVSLTRGTPWWLGPLIAFGVSLVIAVVFRWAVEGPSLRLSRWIGRSIVAARSGDGRRG